MSKEARGPYSGSKYGFICVDLCNLIVERRIALCFDWHPINDTRIFSYKPSKYLYELCGYILCHFSNGTLVIFQIYF